jgi:hypothetical protein
MFSKYTQLSNNIINDKVYVNIHKKAMFDMFSFLLDKKYTFLLSLRFEDLSFQPKLNKKFEEKAKSTKFFVLPVINKEHISYEKEKITLALNLSNKGEEGIDYVITIPIFSIFHILSKDKEVIFFNQLFFNENLSNEKKSIDLFLNNPENKDFN